MITRIKESINDSLIINLMYSLGADRHEDRGEYIEFPTICHNDSSFNASLKLYYYKKSKIFNCYTNCGSHDIIELIQKTLDLDFKESISYLSKFLGIGDIYIPKGFGTVNANYCDYPDEEDFEIPVIENTNILNNFLEFYCPEWINEGISIDSMKKYNIGYYLHQHKITIPHYNLEGNLIGIRGRALSQEDIDSGKKYMPLYLNKKILSHSLRHNLYGLHINKGAIKKYKQCILFEGEKSVLLLDTFYGNESIGVAICGSNISKFQINMLLELGVEEIVIGFDRQFEKVDDEEYCYWKKKIQKVIDRYSELVKITVIWDTNYLLDYKDSPVDKGKEVFEHLFNNRVSWRKTNGNDC